MEPPPAPTVLTSTDEALTVTSPTDVSRLCSATPFLTKETSVEVPPISNVIKFSKPACLAIHIAPDTPPAGPLIRRFTGESDDAFDDASPPSDLRILSFTFFILLLRPFCKFLTYSATFGLTYEFATVVIVLSYSCISGTTSDESETGMFGNNFFLRMTFLISFSCLSLANELINDTVTASTPFFLSAFMSLVN